MMPAGLHVGMGRAALNAPLFRAYASNVIAIVAVLLVRAISQPLADDIPHNRRAAEYAAGNGFRCLGAPPERYDKSRDESCCSNPQLS